ncbi:MAG: helix-turn-helix domain-containing protein [Pseudanabaena sp. Salubria-1]|nr:helix-turn-helix domain-containing protein [Pseudanabaena sp. Salubria-1]
MRSQNSRIKQSRSKKWILPKYSETCAVALLTHQEIADLIGSTRVTVTRIINDLEKIGVLSRKGRKLLFLAESNEHWNYEI